jgi:hypothetical protein
MKVKNFNPLGVKVKRKVNKPRNKKESIDKLIKLTFKK